MFPSDYPHWDFDDPFVSLRRLVTNSAANHSGNARALYGWTDGEKHVVAASPTSRPAAENLLALTAAPSSCSTWPVNSSHSNCCPHRGGSLCEGNLTGCAVQRAGPLQLHPPRRDYPLPWHSWEFDIRTGKSLRSDKVGRSAGVSVERAKLVEGPCIETFRVSVEATTWWSRLRRRLALPVAGALNYVT